MKQYANNISSIIKESEKAGVEKIIVPSSSPESLEQVLNLSNEHANVFGALGIHPHSASAFTDKIKKYIEANLSNKKIIAVGEAGLDFHYNLSPKEVQIAVFKSQIEMAERFNLPLIVHMRKSFDEIKTVFESFKKLPKIVIHCFSGNSAEAEYFLKKGIYLSFTGTITFEKAKELVDVVRTVPVDKFFLEPDSPYLTPEPYRGETNHPKYVKMIAKEIATIKGIELEDIARITTKNACMFFALPFDNSPQFAFHRGKTLYLNLTTDRNTKTDPSYIYRYPYLKGYNLNITKEPTVEELKRTIQNNILKIRNVVFIEHGEPTLRENILKEIAGFAKELKLKTILDTDGLANKYYGRNFALELRTVFDAVNIALNASNPKEYQKFHRPPYGQESFKEVLNFISECSKFIPSVRVSIVNIPGLNLDACINIVKNELKVDFETREYFI